MTQVCCAKERHILNPSSTLIKILETRAIDKVINTIHKSYDYLHVWVIGCMCNCFAIKAQFDFNYWVT